MRDAVERHQIWIYLTAILIGMAVGSLVPETTATWKILLWPVMGALLYTTFTQVPFIHLKSAFRQGRFLAALLVANFIVMPIIIAGLLILVPENAAIKLGVLMVLLVPCTDWFISFTHLGRGDSGRAITAAPILLIAQLLLLPAYLWLFMGEQVVELSLVAHLLPAFFGLIVVPLVLAWVTEVVANNRQSMQRFVAGFGWLPVPFVAIVVFLIAASQVSLVVEAGRMRWTVLADFVLYLLAAAAVGKLLSRPFGLTAPAGRTLVFSLGTRNSFVMLPLALSLPELWRPAVIVIVFQSLVELFGMVAYLRRVANYLIPDNRSNN